MVSQGSTVLSTKSQVLGRPCHPLTWTIQQEQLFLASLGPSWGKGMALMKLWVMFPR